MEMGELTAVDVAGPNDQCPFDHDDKSKAIDNDLKGEGGTLGDRMRGGRSTYFEKNDAKRQPAPNEDSSSNTFGVALPIYLPKCTPEHFPVTCAAHHIIPAQASLRDSELLQWLVHGSMSAQTKGGPSGSGRLKYNVGYDVNGSQNGIWLPGPYALNTDAVRVSMGLPTREEQQQSDDDFGGPVEMLTKDIVEVEGVAAPDDSPESALEDEDIPPGAPGYPAPGGDLELPDRKGTARARKLTKAPSQCNGPFPARYQYYFLYTVSAMMKIGTQYHDAHIDYSERVKEALNEVKIFVEFCAVDGGCDKCKEKNKARTLESTDFPPPVGLIQRLNNISARLCNVLKAAPLGWKWPIYTSKYVLHYYAYSPDPFLTKLK